MSLMQIIKHVQLIGPMERN